LQQGGSGRFAFCQAKRSPGFAGANLGFAAREDYLTGYPAVLEFI